MKQVRIFNSVEEFNAFVNAPDVEVIKVSVRTVKQSSFFQECFAGIVYYKTITTIEGCENDLKDIAHWYGGWAELRKVVERLEKNYAQATLERNQNRD